MDAPDDSAATELAEVPAPAGVVPLAIGYESGVNAVRVGQSRFGTASCVFCGITFVYTAVCFIGAFHASGWDGLAWIIVGFVGNWVGCGVALLLGLIGVVQRRRGRRRAVHGIWLSLVVAAVPFSLAWAEQHR